MKRLLLLSFCLFALVGCATSQVTATNPGALQETRYSKSVSIKPVKQGATTVYVAAQNESGHPDFNVEQTVKSLLTKKGYIVVSVPDKATYLLEAKVLRVSTQDSSQMNRWLTNGFGKNFAQIEAANAADVRVEDKALVSKFFRQKKPYYLLTDIRLSQRSRSAVIDPMANSAATIRPANDIQAYFNSVSHWNRSYTRMFNKTEPMSVNFEVAKSGLETALAYKLANFF